jgi:plasmid stability protein
MPDVLVRDLSDRALELLKAQARARCRSLQAELKHVLEQAARAADVEATRALADRIRGELAGRPLGDSAELVAEDRAR